MVRYRIGTWYDCRLLRYYQKANDDPQDCLRELLRRWLTGVKPHPSWKALIAALRTPAVNYQALASEVDQKYSSRTAGIHEQFMTTSINNVIEPDCVNAEGFLLNQSPSPRPTPKPRRPKSIIVLTEGWKHELIQLFKGITSSQVTVPRSDWESKTVHKTRRYPYCKVSTHWVWETIEWKPGEFMLLEGGRRLAIWNTMVLGELMTVLFIYHVSREG